MQCQKTGWTHLSGNAQAEKELRTPFNLPIEASGDTGNDGGFECSTKGACVYKYLSSHKSSIIPLNSRCVSILLMRMTNKKMTDLKLYPQGKVTEISPFLTLQSKMIPVASFESSLRFKSFFCFLLLVSGGKNPKEVANRGGIDELRRSLRQFCNASDPITRRRRRQRLTWRRGDVETSCDICFMGASSISVACTRLDYWSLSRNLDTDQGVYAGCTDYQTPRFQFLHVLAYHGAINGSNHL